MNEGTAMSHQFRTMSAALVSLTMLTGSVMPARSTDPAPLQLEAKILLGNVRGRIDHMAVDLKRQRLFVAKLDNASAGVLALPTNSPVQTIAGLNEPQGVGYESSADI